MALPLRMHGADSPGQLMRFVNFFYLPPQRKVGFYS